jgi:hypothetical protein
MLGEPHFSETAKYNGKHLSNRENPNPQGVSSEVRDRTTANAV